MQPNSDAAIVPNHLLLHVIGGFYHEIARLRLKKLDPATLYQRVINGECVLITVDNGQGLMVLSPWRDQQTIFLELAISRLPGAIHRNLPVIKLVVAGIMGQLRYVCCMTQKPAMARILIGMGAVGPDSNGVYQVEVA